VSPSRFSFRFLALVALPAVFSAAVLSGTATAATLRVCHSGCTYAGLQQALDAALPGDTILLRAGETFVGNYRLRPKSGDAFIVIRSDAATTALPGAGERLVPQGRPGANVSLSSLARLVGQGGAYKSQPVLRADPGAHHYVLQFVEFDGTANIGYETLIALGVDDPQPAPPHHIVLDRVYIHGHPYKGQKRGISLNGRYLDVIDSYISDIKAVNADSQALAAWNGQGPFKIVNNYIEGAGENILFGGGWPATLGLIASDIEIRHNHITKPATWRNPILSQPSSVRASRTSGGGSLASGVHYFKVVALMTTGTATAVSLPSAEVSVSVASGDRATISWSGVSGASAYRIYRGQSAGGESVYMQTSTAVTSFVYAGSGESSAAPPTSGTKWVAKNLIELKNAQRVTIDGNLLEHNWAGAQAGYAVVLTPRNHNGTAPWAAVRDVTFTNNILRHSAGAINILGYDDTQAEGSALTERIMVGNNLFDDITPASWGGGLTRVFLIGQGASRVTFDSNTIFHGTSTVLSAYGAPMPLFVFTNNIAVHAKYGVMGASSSSGSASLAAYFPGCVFSNNVLAGGDPSRYPPGNTFPTLAEWNASFVDLEGGDYRLLSSSVFYRKGTGGSVPGTDFVELDDAQATPSEPLPPPSSNGPPTADAGGPYTAAAGTDLTVDGTGSSDPENGITSYKWTWGDDIVIHASDVPPANIKGNWAKASVSGAAEGTALVNPNKGAAKVATPLAAPASYVDIKFRAASGVPYYIWFRMQAESNSYSNDSVYVQLSGAVTASGSALARIGSTSALSFILEQGRDAGVSGWGWTDSGWESVASPIYFPTAGEQTIRLQPREDGVRIDQIVISSVAYASKIPGLTKADTTIVSRSLGTGTGVHATHRYARAGIYPIVLLVTDELGATDIDTTTVTVR
jgi:hypothetical protein